MKPWPTYRSVIDSMYRIGAVGIKTAVSAGCPCHVHVAAIGFAA